MTVAKLRRRGDSYRIYTIIHWRAGRRQCPSAYTESHSAGPGSLRAVKLELGLGQAQPEPGPGLTRPGPVTTARYGTGTATTIHSGLEPRRWADSARDSESGDRKVTVVSFQVILPPGRPGRPGRADLYSSSRNGT